MTEMNPSMKQKHTHRQRTDVVAKGEGLGERWIGTSGLADAN